MSKEHNKEKSEFFVHPLAVCESTAVGSRTNIWPFSHIQEFVVIGVDCNVGEGVFIENGAKLGNRVTVKNGVQIWSGVELEDDVFIGPNVTFTNDRYPASGNSNFNLELTLVQEGASIGANATILPGIQIGSKSIVGAGSVVTKGVPARAVVFGNPARIVRYLD